MARPRDPVDFHGEFVRVEGARVNTPFTSAERVRPELYFGGSSGMASDLAIKHGDALLRLGGTPDEVAARIGRVLAAGREVGLLFSIVSRPTRADAVDSVMALIEQAKAVQERFRRESAESVGFATTYGLGSDHEQWPRPYLWTGAIPFLGPLSLALVGTPDEIATALLAYRDVGVTQFLFHGRPDSESLPHFCQEILPRVREREAAGW